MDFINVVNSAISDSALGGIATRWWGLLASEASRKGMRSDEHTLVTNIQRSLLFERHCSVGAHLEPFLREIALLMGTGLDPLEIATQAIENTKRMICSGPAAGAFGGEACSIFSIRDVVQYYVKPSSRASHTRFSLRSWAYALCNDRFYYVHIKQTESYRGKLPCRFWTAKTDLSALGLAPSARRVCSFLGLDFDPRRLYIRIPIRKEDRIVFQIPTCWDGYTNPHFRENDRYDASNASTCFGYTLDIEKGIAGAREVVTLPVLISNTGPGEVVT